MRRAALAVLAPRSYSFAIVFMAAESLVGPAQRAE
jgi:hypothetical protein